MSSVDLSTVDTDDLLAEVAKRCGSGWKPRARSNRPRRTKAEWAADMAKKARDAYHAATDPSVRARHMEEMGKFELLTKRYRDQGL
jgi:hypothetical protein